MLDRLARLWFYAAALRGKRALLDRGRTVFGEAAALERHA